MSISPSDPTFRGVHRVLLAGKNMQALARLYFDLFPLLEGDQRLHIAFTVIPGSYFEWAAHRFLRERELKHELKVIPWSEAKDFAPELIISGSPTAELFRLDAPLMFLTHGAGNNRLRKDLTGPYGLAPEQLLGPRRWWRLLHRRVVDWLPLAGAAAYKELARTCPEALPNAEIVGDLRHERMRMSRSKRRQIRRALGLERGQLLIVVASTWGGLSLVGEGGTSLQEQLLTGLPIDRFRIGTVPHPNIEHGDGPSVAGVLAPLLKNGLLMPPVEEGWSALVIAADLIIGDSGSVTQYAAAIGKPVLLAAFGFDQMPADGALAEFGRSAPRLNPDKPFEPQIHEAIGRGQEFDFGVILASDRSASDIIYAKVYSMLGISTGEKPEPEMLPDPELHPRCKPTSAWECSVRFGTSGAEWTRRPVQVPAKCSGLLVVRCDECPDSRLLAHAGVLLHHRDVLPEDEAPDELEALLEDWPHSRLASVRIGERTLLLRTRRRLLVKVRCAPALLDIIPAALAEWLAEQAPDAARLDTPDAFVDFEGCFEAKPAILSVEHLG